MCLFFYFKFLNFVDGGAKMDTLDTPQCVAREEGNTRLCSYFRWLL